MKFLALLLLTMLTGCSALASDRTTVACQTADAATTVAALRHGAVEANPLVDRVLAIGWLPGFVLFKIAVTVALVRWLEPDTEAKRAPRAGINVMTCGAALHNVRTM